MSLKIFLSNINTELGHSLVELFRNDHLCMQTPNIIVGTAQSSKDAQNDEVYHTLNFGRNPNLVLKAAMQSDIVVLDLRSQFQQNELIIKYITDAAPERKSRIIAVSSFLTWANTPTEQSTNDTRQHNISIEHRKAYVPSQRAYRERLPAWPAIFQCELERSLIELATRNHMNISIVSAGVTYGLGYETFIGEFEKVLKNQHPLNCQGDGSNTIPMVHVVDLAKMVYTLATSPKQSSQRLFYFAVDQAESTQQQILDILGEVLAVEKQTTKSHSVVCTIHSQEMQLNLAVSTSPELRDIDWTCREGLVKNKERIIQEFLTYRNFKFKHVEVQADLPEIANCKNAFERMGYKIFTKQLLWSCLEKIEAGEINTGLMSSHHCQLLAEEIASERREFAQRNIQSGDKKKKGNDKELVPTYSYSRNIIQVAFEKILNNWQYRHRLIIIDQSLNHLVAQIDSPNHKRYRICSSEQNQSKWASGRNHETILFDSIDYRQLVGETPVRKQSTGNCPSIQNQSSNYPLQPSQARTLQSPQLINMKQYLIDNIMPAVTEAMVRIQEEKPKDIISFFIQAMRQIEANDNQYIATIVKKKTEQSTM